MQQRSVLSYLKQPCDRLITNVCENKRQLHEIGHSLDGGDKKNENHDLEHETRLAQIKKTGNNTEKAVGPGEHYHAHIRTRSHAVYITHTRGTMM